MGSVTGLGQCSLDYIATVESYPLEDCKEEILDWSSECGGPVATALVSLSRLGIETAFMGRVSDDSAGRRIRKSLKSEGVVCRGLRTRAGGKSQTAFIVVNKKNGERTIFWQRPTVAPLTPKEVSAAGIKRSSFLLLDGLMEEASVHAALVAKKAGVPIMLDAGSVRPGMMKLAKLSDYIVASEKFARELSSSPRGALKELSKFAPRAATVTLGKVGSLTWHNGRIFKTPAFKIAAVDTTGAGDVFHGGYTYGLLKGWDIGRTVEFASAFAALKCTAPGGRSGIPTLRKTLKFIKEQKSR